MDNMIINKLIEEGLYSIEVREDFSDSVDFKYIKESFEELTHSSYLELDPEIDAVLGVFDSYVVTCASGEHRHRRASFREIGFNCRPINRILYNYIGSFLLEEFKENYLLSPRDYEGNWLNYSNVICQKFEKLGIKVKIVGDNRLIYINKPRREKIKNSHLVRRLSGNLYLDKVLEIETKLS